MVHWQFGPLPDRAAVTFRDHKATGRRTKNEDCEWCLALPSSCQETVQAKLMNQIKRAANSSRRGQLKRRNSKQAWDSRVTAPSIKLDLVIECHRLPKKDSFSEADRICLRLLRWRHLHYSRVSRELDVISLIVGEPAASAGTSSSV